MGPHSPHSSKRGSRGSLMTNSRQPQLCYALWHQERPVFVIPTPHTYTNTDTHTGCGPKFDHVFGRPGERAAARLLRATSETLHGDTVYTRVCVPITCQPRPHNTLELCVCLQSCSAHTERHRCRNGTHQLIHAALLPRLTGLDPVGAAKAMVPPCATAGPPNPAACLTAQALSGAG